MCVCVCVCVSVCVYFKLVSCHIYFSLTLFILHVMYRELFCEFLCPCLLNYYLLLFSVDFISYYLSTSSNFLLFTELLFLLFDFISYYLSTSSNFFLSLRCKQCKYLSVCVRMWERGDNRLFCFLVCFSVTHCSSLPRHFFLYYLKAFFACLRCFYFNNLIFLISWFFYSVVFLMIFFYKGCYLLGLKQ
jgi:hypothetical protein